VEDDVEIEDDIEIDAEADMETEVEEYIPVEMEDDEIQEAEILPLLNLCLNSGRTWCHE